MRKKGKQPRTSKPLVVGAAIQAPFFDLEHPDAVPPEVAALPAAFDSTDPRPVFVCW